MRNYELAQKTNFKPCLYTYKSQGKITKEIFNKFLSQRIRHYVQTHELGIHQKRIKNLAIHSFIPDISIAPLQFHYYSEALKTTALILYWS